jgi:hypothetical protein
LAEQAAYAEVFRDLRAFEAQLGNTDGAGRGLVSDVVERLAAGGLDPDLPDAYVRNERWSIRA